MGRSKPSLLERLVDGATLVGGWMLLLLSILIAIEVTGRKLFEFSFQGVDEIGGYVLAASSAIGFSYALLMRGHVRVDLFLRKVPKRTQDFANWIAMIGMTVFACVLLWQTITMYSRTVSLGASAGTPLDTPLIYPQGVWVTGLALFTIVCTGALWRLTRVCFLRGQEREELDLSLEEEIETEAADARRRIAATDARGGRPENGD